MQYLIRVYLEANLSTLTWRNFTALKVTGLIFCIHLFILYILTFLTVEYMESESDKTFFAYSLTLCILMDFSIHIDTISMGLPILYFKGSQVAFSKL